MFWKFNLLTTSQIDTLLDQEDVKKGSVTLEDILNEDDVLQECKGQNKKLIDFLMRPENMEELVNLVIQEPDEEKDEKSRFKYPNTACELLISDVPLITDKLAGEEVLLNKVYSFLEVEETLNPLQASFFGKVMGLLITRKSELMLEFLQSREDFVGHLVHHIGTSAIMDLLLRLITCIENTDTRNACINWLNEQSIIQKLVGLIDPVHSEDKHCNASQTLCDIIRIGRDHMSHLQEKADNDPLLSAIESQEIVSDLLDHMFSSETKVESVLVNGLQVIQTLLEFRKTSYLYLNSPEGCQEQLTALDTERLAHGVNNTLAAVSPKLKNLHELLVIPPRQHYHAMPTTMGNLDPPLGNTRLQTVRLVTSLLITNTHSVNQELANLGTIAVIIDLFFKYPFNNFLHTQVEQCLCTILSMTPYELQDGQHSHPLLDSLFRDINFLEKILDAWEDHSNNQNKPGVHRPGYMGHLTRMANTVAECSEKAANSDRIKELYKDYSEDLQQRWDGFISGTLAEVNKTNTVDLVSNTIDRSSSDSEDPDFSHIPFPQESAMQQAFSDYQLQQMTSTFIDQFGFNEDEFAEQEERVDASFTDKISSINFEINADETSNAATLFEQACNERMQQFDDPDSDEDLWEDKEVTFSKSPGGRTSSPTTQDTPKHLSSRHDSDSDEDEQNSEGSTDSDEELESPRRIYQVPSTTTSTSTPTSTTTSTGDKIENMDVDSADAWANLDKTPTTTTANPIDMETGASPWEQIQQSEPQSAGSTSNSSGEENWAKFDQIFPSSSSDEKDVTPTEELKKEDESGKETWANFTNIEVMESSAGKVVNSDIRSVSPIAMDTNETQAPSSNRMAQYLVSSGTDSSQQPTSSSQSDEDTSPPGTPRSPPGTPRPAWNTPRESAVPPQPSPSVPAETISSSTETQPKVSGEDKPSEKSDDVDECSTEVSSSTPSLPDTTPQESSENVSVKCYTSTDVDTGLPVTSVLPDSMNPIAATTSTDTSNSAISSHIHQTDNSTSNINTVNTTTEASPNQFPDDADFDDDDLNDNFNFLAGSGLMKSSESAQPATGETAVKSDEDAATSTENQVNSSDEGNISKDESTVDKLEEKRAQAKGALEEFDDVVSSTGKSTAQNGPV